MNLNYYRIFTNFVLGLFLFISGQALAASNQSVVYQGRVVRPDGTTPNTGNIAFSLSVYSPTPAKCLLYSENQSLNMTGANGMFSLALGAGTRTDNGAHAFSKIFINGGTLTGLTCANGATSYSPSATDDRSLVASFNDAGTVVALSAMSIKSIPFALQAQEIGGYGVNDIVKIHPTVGSATTFTSAEMAIAKIITGLACAANQIIKWNGTTWVCSTDVSGGTPSDSGYGSGNKGIVAFDTDAATSGVTIASGVAKLSDVLAAPGTFGSTTKTVTLTVNAHGRITAASHADIALPATQLTQSGASNGEVLKWNGTSWAPAADSTGTAPGDASYAAKGLVQGLTDAATSGLTIASGVISVNSGTGANQIVKLDASSKLPAVDGSALTNIAATSYSGVLPIANGGTNNGSLGVTNGGVVYADGSKLMTSAAGTSGQALLSGGAGAPTWGTLSVGAGGTGATSFATNQLVGTNGSGNALQAVTCGLSKVISFDASGNYGCYDVSAIYSGFADGGNTFTATATLGANSNHDLAFETNGTTKMTILKTGAIGIGTVAPTALLDVAGTISATTSATATAIANRDSPIFSLVGKYWNGAASTNDMWTMQAKYGAGSNPYSEMVFDHTGTSGYSFFKFNGLNTAIYGWDQSLNSTVLNGASYGTARFPTLRAQNYSGGAGAGGYPVIAVRNSRGEDGAAIATDSDAFIGTIIGEIYDGSDFVSSVSIDYMTTQLQTATAHGSAIRFQTTPNDSVTPAERMRIDHNGNVGIGVTASPTSRLQVKGGSLVVDSVSNTVAYINFGAGNVQMSSTAAGTINICGLKDGGTYTLVLTGVADNTTVTVNAYPTYDNTTSCSGVPMQVDLGGGNTTFLTSGNTNILSFVYFSARGANGTVYGMPATNYNY